MIFTGCSEPKDKITTGPEDELPTTKDPLKEYHPVEYLTVGLRSAPILSQNNHPDGWNNQDCIQCHRSPLKEIEGICTGCHGENKPIEAKSDCSHCHKTQSEFGDPASGSHQAHVAQNSKDTTCVECHTGGPSASVSHANGILDIKIANDGKYTALPQQEDGVTGSCSNITCHPDVRKWGGDCSSCHDNPPGTGIHEKHLAQEDISCQSCHLETQHDSDKESGTIETGGIEYDSITGDCTSTCHEESENWTCSDCHSYPPDTGNHPAEPHAVSCDECHSDHDHSYKAATQPLDFSNPEMSFAQGGNYNDSSNMCSGIPCHTDEREWGSSCTDCHDSPPDTGAHEVHVEQQSLKCQDCHSDNQHDLDNESGFIDLGGISYDAVTGDCTSTCHTERKWSCTDCHSFPPDTGNHTAHNGDCSKCHEGHDHSYKAATQPEDFTDTQVSMADGGEFNSSSDTCSGLDCHESRIWGSNCTDCHSSPPETGTHELHVDEQDLTCQDCHADNQHDLDNNSGSIELGGIEYDPDNGNCTSTCHEQERWDCTSCHESPPATGNHSDHESDCGQCHQDHQHSYRAATTPDDLSAVETDLAVDGDFDAGSGTCNNVECHPDPRVWGTDCSACHLSPPATGPHALHVEQEKLRCYDCHAESQHDLDNSSGSIELGGIEYDSVTGNCTSACHEQKLWSCTECHDDPPDTGNHPSHHEPSGKFFALEEGAELTPISCGECHLGHEHSFKAALAPEDLSMVQVEFAQGGIFDANSSCSNMACHDNMLWGSSCSDCHATPPETGLHQRHIESDLNCTQCHEGNQHDLDVSSGAIETGGITYDGNTGDCTSSCHAEQGWDCTSCHDYPPDAGQHEAHAVLGFGCNMCHNEHEHTYKAATAPVDFEDVIVKFVIGGDWDELARTCTSIGCHDNRQW